MNITGSRWVRNTINSIRDCNLFSWVPSRHRIAKQRSCSAGPPSHSLAFVCQRHACLLYSLRSTYDMNDRVAIYLLSHCFAPNLKRLHLLRRLSFPLFGICARSSGLLSPWHSQIHERPKLFLLFWTQDKNVEPIPINSLNESASCYPREGKARRICGKSFPGECPSPLLRTTVASTFLPSFI
jgi:hypothetical protein